MVKSVKILKIVNIISFLIMLLVNALANVLPINDMTTGDVSSLYPNLFTPAAITFSIWGVIYLLLFTYVVYTSTNKGEADLLRVNILFPITCLFNAAWIVTWHYQWVLASLIVMVLLLVTLIYIYLKINKKKIVNYVFVKIPFSMYLGWISVATIANVTVLLVENGFRGGALSESVWTIILMIVAFILSFIFLNVHKNYTYVLVIVWALTGIIIRHIEYHNSEYIEVVISAIVLITLIVVNVIYTIFKKKKEVNV